MHDKNNRVFVFVLPWASIGLSMAQIFNAYFMLICVHVVYGCSVHTGVSLASLALVTRELANGIAENSRSRKDS
jgi:hypothetical protein